MCIRGNVLVMVVVVCSHAALVGAEHQSLSILCCAVALLSSKIAARSLGQPDLVSHHAACTASRVCSCCM